MTEKSRGRITRNRLKRAGKIIGIVAITFALGFTFASVIGETGDKSRPAAAEDESYAELGHYSLPEDRVMVHFDGEYWWINKTNETITYAGETSDGRDSISLASGWFFGHFPPDYAIVKFNDRWYRVNKTGPSLEFIGEDP